MKIFDWFSPAVFEEKASTYKFSDKAKVNTLWLMAAVLVLFLLVVSHVLPVFIWAAVAAYLFNPAITFISAKTKTRRSLSIILLYAIVAVIIFFSLKLIVPAISNEISDLASGNYDQTTSIIGRVAAQGQVVIFDIPINMKDLVGNISTWVASQISSEGLTIFFGAVERAILLLVFFVVTFYFLLDSEKYKDDFERMVPQPYRSEIAHLIEKGNMTLGAYIRAQIVLMLIMSIASFIVLSCLRIKYAGVLSIMTGVLEVIPVIGPICATVVVTIVALLQANNALGFSSIMLAVIVAAAYFILRQLEDYFVIPNVAARFVKVNPVVGIFALLVGGGFWGILGLFLAIPTAAIIKVIFGYLHNKIVE